MIEAAEFHFRCFLSQPAKVEIWHYSSGGLFRPDPESISHGSLDLRDRYVDIELTAGHRVVERCDHRGLGGHHSGIDIQPYG